MRSFVFWLKFHCSSFLGSNWQLPSIGLDAIIWTNVNPIHWRIYAAQGGDKLNLGSASFSHYGAHCMGVDMADYTYITWRTQENGRDFVDISK